MARTEGALFSEQARGTLADTITYQRNRKNPQAHKRLNRQDRRTASQLSRRSLFADAVAAWQALTEPEKEAYRIRASGTGGRSGYNIFLSEYTPAPPVQHAVYGENKYGEVKYGD
jgi:alpha-ketoglutarate-dependent taurine dioxygenase